MCKTNRTALQEIDLGQKHKIRYSQKKIYNEQQIATTTNSNNITLLWIPEHILAEQTVEITLEISKTLELVTIKQIEISYKEIKTVHHKYIFNTIWQNEKTNIKHTTSSQKRTDKTFRTQEHNSTNNNSNQHRQKHPTHKLTTNKHIIQSTHNQNLQYMSSKSLYRSRTSVLQTL